MNIHRIGRKLQVQINEFSGKLSPHFSKPIRRFVEQMIHGMLLSQDVKLSEIGRALEENVGFMDCRTLSMVSTAFTLKLIGVVI